ncbi:MAG: T9SS type A sorting domain-containing protein, partial [Bacteroidetes bacterium]|nr:T9SS type A sorting domain-containing protein [Bacteroidota bacterium]
IKNSCQAGSPFVMVTGLAVDESGNLWISNWQSDCANSCGGGPYIHVKKIDGTWESFDFGFCFPKDIVIDDNDFKWIRLDQSNEYGILVINDKNDTAIHLTDVIGKGGLPDINVQCVTKDKNGDIWVGTNKGVAVFYNPSSVFTDGDLNASTPIFDQRPLLETEIITTIAVDGGNRKWIGSRNGLWLFDDGATEEIINFTVDNSPLLSNNIIDIAIHGETGEVFIGTDKGIISFRGTSTESESVHNNVEVFPNPVEPDFYGWVGIKGLATDAIVKITDVSGKLVYETQAEGGMAVWNVNDYNGDRVKAGVYLVFSTTKDEKDSYVAKIAVKE